LISKIDIAAIQQELFNVSLEIFSCLLSEINYISANS
jgi:hypothetical protein